MSGMQVNKYGARRPRGPGKKVSHPKPKKAKREKKEKKGRKVHIDEILRNWSGSL